MNGHKLICVAATAVLSLSSFSATAADSGWYVGGAVGQANADIDKSELDSTVVSAFLAAGAPVLTGSSTLDDSDTSFEFHIGYQFNPYFSLEGGYLQLASAKYTSLGTVNPPGPVTSAPASYAINFDGRGFRFSVVGSAPIGKFVDLHAKLGSFIAKTEISEAVATTGVSGSESYSQVTEELMFGIGAGVRFGQNWRIALDWARFNDVGDEDETGEADVDNLSLSLAYHF